jgi:hypothetical protein
MSVLHRTLPAVFMLDEKEFSLEKIKSSEKRPEGLKTFLSINQYYHHLQSFAAAIWFPKKNIIDFFNAFGVSIGENPICWLSR